MVQENSLYKDSAFILIASLLGHTILIFLTWFFSFGPTFSDFIQIWWLTLLNPMIGALLLALIVKILVWVDMDFIVLKYPILKYTTFIFLFEVCLIIIKDFIQYGLGF